MKVFGIFIILIFAKEKEKDHQTALRSLAVAQMLCPLRNDLPATIVEYNVRGGNELLQGPASCKPSTRLKSRTFV